MKPILIAKAICVSDEEAQMIEAFRRFKATMLAPEATFQWKTQAGAPAEPPALVADTPEKGESRAA